MPYNIKQYTYDQAKKLGVQVKPSSVKSKKIDVFKDGKKVVSVGALGMNDYPTYIQTKGKEYADTRRRLYKIRHEKTRGKVGSASYYADRLLW
jgi:phage terminase small subunit